MSIVRRVLHRSLVTSTIVLTSACGGSSSSKESATTAASSTDIGGLSAADARQIASDAYVYGVPLLDQYKVIYAFSIDKSNPQYKGPWNTVLNVARVFTPDDTAFVTPNSDTPYTFAGLDLRVEPVVITVPKIDPARYFVFQLMDLYTFNFAYIGTRATGNDGGVYMIAGPGWTGTTPAGVTKVIRSETQLVSVVGRTQLFDPADLPKVKAVQAGYTVEPLSTYAGTPAPAPPPPVQFPAPLPPGEERTSLAFFDRLAFLLQFATPPHPSEVDLRRRFERIGVVAGQPFDANKFSPGVQEALKAGMADGQKLIDQRRAEVGSKTDALFGTREFLRNDYVARATGTQMGIGANSRDEAIYPVIDKDSDGQRLDGTTNRYTLRFAPGGLPPVNAFWSITMYNLPAQLLVRNPINRYLINAPMLPSLTKDADGGITVYLQADSPGAAKESNWLPAPAGPFMVTLRYYLPKPALLDGTWKSPAIEKRAQ